VWCAHMSNCRRGSAGGSAYPEAMSRDEPIRILRVIARLNVGGPALHVSYLTRGLAERGYETTLVAGTVGEGEGSMEYVARDLGVEPIYIPQLQREISPGSDLLAVKRLREIMHEVRPHVVHTHTAKAGAVGRVAASLAGTARPPVIVHTFHGHVLRGYFSRPVTNIFRFLERELARNTDALIAVSPQVREDLVALGVAPAGRIAVVRLGLDLDQRVAAVTTDRATIRRELGLAEDAFLVGWLGRMTEIKRADILLRAFAQLRNEVPGAALVLVGDGPLRGELEQFADRLGVAGACRFVGYREEVGAMYAAVDAVALTSANEGTPVSIIEAQAAGLPVVSTDVGGVRDVVVDDRTGILAPAGNVDAVADALLRLALEPETRRAFGESGRERVVDRYAVPRLIDDVDCLYRTLIDVRAPHARRIVDAVSTPLPPTLPTRRGVRPSARRLRIAIVSQYFPPEIGATQTRMQAFAEHLAARGHEVTVVTELPNHPIGVIPDRFRGHLYVDDRSNSYRIVRVWVAASREKTQATRMAFYLSYMALAVAAAPVLGPLDVVLATTPPLFAGAAGLAIARLKGARFVLDVRDLWPAAAVSLNQISEGPTLRAAEAVERTLYRRADQVVAVTRPFCAHVDRVRGFGSSPHIPNGTLERFFVDQPPTARDRLGAPPGSFLVTFAGTLGIAQALPTVLDAADRTDGNTLFSLIGEGPMKDVLVEDVERRGLHNVVFHDQVAPTEIGPVLAASDALLVSLSGNPTFADFVPSKMIDFMAVGRPVVLSAAGESARLLERSGGGLAVRPEDPDALADAVRWIASHPHEAEEFGRRGREFARRRLRSVQAERLEEVLLDVVHRR
jgi:glycosyltransferase involved in cell wall biosynthesis